MTEIKVECCSQTIHITFFLQYILSLDRHAARHRIQLDFNGTTHRSEFVFSLFQKYKLITYVSERTIFPHQKISQGTSVRFVQSEMTL